MLTPLGLFLVLRLISHLRRLLVSITANLPILSTKLPFEIFQTPAFQPQPWPAFILTYTQSMAVEGCPPHFTKKIRSWQAFQRSPKMPFDRDHKSGQILHDLNDQAIKI